VLRATRTGTIIFGAAMLAAAALTGSRGALAAAPAAGAQRLHATMFAVSRLRSDTRSHPSAPKLENIRNQTSSPSRL
jgi:hypothetical protein